LFRLARTTRATAIFQHLGANGVIARHFREHPTWLRFGIPGEPHWDRLAVALAPPAYAHLNAKSWSDLNGPPP
jgi:cobalamin biosynthetic protein CobC